MALAKVLNLKYNSVDEIPFLLNKLKKIKLGASSRNNNNWLSDEDVVVMTQGGKDPAFVVWGEGQSAQVVSRLFKVPILMYVSFNNRRKKNFRCYQKLWILRW